jgi:hypothetical protein
MQPNVIGVHVPSGFPAERGDGGIRGRADARGFGADEVVLAIRFVPDRDDLHTVFSDALAGGELCARLVRKPIADANGIFIEGKHALKSAV